MSVFLGWLAGLALALVVASVVDLSGATPVLLGFSLTMLGALIGMAAR